MFSQARRWNNKKKESKIKAISCLEDLKERTMNSMWLIIALVPCVLGGIVNPQDNEVFAGRSSNDGLENAFKYFTECQEKNLETCLGIKAVTLMNRMARTEELKLVDGVSFLRFGEVDRSGRALSESELENSLPEETSQKRSRLIDLFLDATFRFLKSHTLQLRLPETTSTEIERALQEGRTWVEKTFLKILFRILLAIFFLWNGNEDFERFSFWIANHFWQIWKATVINIYCSSGIQMRL